MEFIINCGKSIAENPTLVMFCASVPQFTERRQGIRLCATLEGTQTLL